jgi:hypothetical protein
MDCIKSWHANTAAGYEVQRHWRWLQTYDSINQEYECAAVVVCCWVNSSCVKLRTITASRSWSSVVSAIRFEANVESWFARF